MPNFLKIIHGLCDPCKVWSAGLVPDPSFYSAFSISASHSVKQDTASFLEKNHWEIHSLFS